MKNAIKGVPCSDCGWKHGGQHICVDLSKHIPGEGIIQAKGVKRRPMSDEQKMKISEGQRRRWATFRRES